MRRTNLIALGATLACLALALPATAQQFAIAGVGGSYLGIYMTELSDATRGALGLGKDEGVLVEEVVDGAPAARAGMQAGDVILEYDGRPVDGSSGLGRLLNRSEAGAEVPVIVWRAGKRVALTVELEERRRPGLLGLGTPAIFDTPPAPETPLPALLRVPSYSLAWGLDPDRRLGVRTQELTGQLAEYFGVGRGVLLTWVVPDSAAGRAGLKAGDVLVALGGQPVAGAEDLGLILRDEDTDEMAVELVRRGEKKSLTLKF